ncbi:hypothetical protein [Shimia thalassica]|jgi:DNA-binding FrmR family transcriptional regulator|uniref:hypothetical protein n=1 Tax=Shimia thalassica TaxID=1715693 RepID=UPI0026E2E2DD|nr:hypothetical protein [Shimia thalassica]MDO6478128.1 hypothetical protein [Shimia thalassica]
MAYFDELADKLARDVIEVQKALDDDQLIQDIAATLEASSSTMHEAFMTAVRVHISEERARAQLDARLKAKGFALRKS